MSTFKETPKLYHYTSLSSIVGILRTGVLRFGALPRMNDITEAIKEIYIQNDDNDPNWDIFNQVEEELKHIGLISLTQDGIRPGYAINSMWGHYADKGEGCCIILEKNSIINECNKLGLKFGSITYDGGMSHIIVDNESNCCGVLESSFERNFLHKSQDWESEQEFRILNFNTNNGIIGLPIMDCIIAVVFHTNCKSSVFDCSLKQDTIALLNDIQALEYHYSLMWGNDENAQLVDSKGNDWVGTELKNYKLDI